MRRIKQLVGMLVACHHSRITRTNTQQRWSRGHKARSQGQGHKKNPRPRPSTALPRTDPFEAKDRNARGQGQRPRTQPQVFSKKKKVFKKFFLAISKKKAFKNLFQAFSSKKRLLQFFFRRSTKFQQFKRSAVLEPRTGQFSRT